MVLLEMSLVVETNRVFQQQTSTYKVQMLQIFMVVQIKLEP